MTFRRAISALVLVASLAGLSGGSALAQRRRPRPGSVQPALDVVARRVSIRRSTRPGESEPSWPVLSRVAAAGTDVVITVQLAREFRGPAPTVSLVGTTLVVRATGAEPPTCGLSFASVHEVYELRIRRLAPGTYSISNGATRQSVTVTA